MRYFLLSLALVAYIVAFFPTPVSADPSTGTWLNMGTTSVMTVVRPGSTAVFAFPVGTANSTLITVAAPNADICFDADTAGAGGTGRATAKMALTAAGSDNAAITLPALVTTNLDCNPIVTGTYWVQIDTAATAAENPVVVIFGR